MDSAAFQTEGKKGDSGFTDVEVMKLKRQQKHLLVALAALLLLSLFCVSMVIWLAVEVSDDDDNNGGGAVDLNSKSRCDNAALAIQADGNVVTLTSRPDSSAEARPLLVGTGYWTEKASLSYGHCDHAAVAVDDYIYIIGGQNDTQAVVDDVFIYDTIMDSYEDGPALPTPLYKFGFAYDDKNRQIYVFGGMDVFNGDAVDSVYILDVDAREWMEGPKLPSPRSDLCGAFVDGHVYAIGGYSLGEEETLSTVEALDIDSEQWEERKDMPTPRGDCSAAAIAGGVIVVGGFNNQNREELHKAFRNEVEFYSPENDVWEERAPVQNTGGHKTIIALPRDRLLVVGGETHNRGMHKEVATHHVEEYSMSEDLWIARAPLLAATFRAAGAYVDGVVYVFGGDPTCEHGGHEEGEGDEDHEEEGEEHEEDEEGGGHAHHHHPPDCVELAVLQVYFDTEQPNVFIA